MSLMTTIRENFRQCIFSTTKKKQEGPPEGPFLLEFKISLQET